MSLSLAVQSARRCSLSFPLLLRIRNIVRLLFIAGMLGLTAACGSGGHSNATLRVVNGSSMAVSFTLNGKDFASNVTVFTAIGPSEVSAGSSTLGVQESKLTQSVGLSANTQTTTIYFGTPPFEDDLYVLTDDTTSAGQNAKLRIVNAAQNTPGLAVDVYVQSPGTTPTGKPFATGLNATTNDVTPYQQVSPKSYEVYFTQTGTQAVFYHTGTLTLAAGQNRTVVLFNNYPVNPLQYASMTLADLN